MRANRSSRKRPCRHLGAQVAVGAGDQLKVALHLTVAAHGVEALFFHGLEQHGLLVQTQLADLVEEQHALVRRTQQAGPVGRRAREGALLVAEQGGRRAVAAQRGAVHFDELACHLVASFLQLNMRRARCDLPAPVGPVNRMGARERTATRSISSISALKRALRVAMPLFRNCTASRCSAKALRHHVVAREIQVDQRKLPAALRRLLALRGRGLQQHARNAARLHQQEQADLRHVRAGGDVRPVLLALGVEAVGLRTSQRARHTPRQSPTGRQWTWAPGSPWSRARRWRCRPARLRQRLVRKGVEQLQPVDHHVFVLHQRHGGAPLLPPPRAPAGVELRAQEADDHLLLNAFIERRAAEILLISAT
jgi:hypothetical protein